MEQKKENEKKPEKKFVAGSISATIWNNTTIKNDKEISYKTISFDRRYKDKQGNWQSTNHLRVSDLPKAMLVLRKAYEHIILRESTNGSLTEAPDNEEIDLSEIEIDDTI